MVWTSVFFTVENSLRIVRTRRKKDSLRATNRLLVGGKNSEVDANDLSKSGRSSFKSMLEKVSQILNDRKRRSMMLLCLFAKSSSTHQSEINEIYSSDILSKPDAD